MALTGPEVEEWAKLDALIEELKQHPSGSASHAFGRVLAWARKGVSETSGELEQDYKVLRELAELVRSGQIY